jgi:hypothetical protein
MNLDEQKDRIESLLKAAGFERLCPVTHKSSINDVETWTGTLRTGSGSAEFEVRAYSFSDQPGLVVDYEEEKEALNAKSTQTAAWRSAAVLLHAERTTDVGILLTCRRSDEHLFREMPPETDIGRYSYHPQLDRVFGGDYFRDINGHPAKVCVTSLKRAQELHPVLAELHECYRQAPSWPRKLECPFPMVLTVIGTLGDWLGAANAPPEYRELALVITLIAGMEVVRHSPPAGASARQDCITQLFRGMRAVHANRFTFSRPGGGCNYVPGFITTAGALNDAYFVWRDPTLERVEELWQSQEMDLMNGLLTVAGFENGPPAAKCEVLREGIRAYIAPASLRDDIVELVFESGPPGSDFVRHVERVAAAVLATTADF